MGEDSLPNLMMGFSAIRVWILNMVIGELAYQHDNQEDSTGPDIHLLAVISSFGAVNQLWCHVDRRPAETVTA